MDGLLHLLLTDAALSAANVERMRRTLHECFPQTWTSEQFYGTPDGALPESSISRLYVWITKRLRYRNRKAYATARRHGIPRWSVGRGLTLAFVNGSTVFTRVTVRGVGSVDVLTLEMETEP
jgi:hypothetical protein